MKGPSSTLVLLVTCSRDETRRDMAVEVMKNLAEKIPQAGLQNSFVVFDNASTFRDHLAFAPAGATIVESPENVGYWSAIKWVLENQQKLKNRTYDYLYCVESDLIHTDMRPLAECERFLNKNPEIPCVRTQEFSVRWNWRYNKHLHYLPFRNLRSCVSLKNGVTGERAWFRQTEKGSSIWLTSLHAKLPALNRIDAIQKTFSSLEKMEKFGEMDFFVSMREISPVIGILDGGLYYQASTPYTRKIVSGSWSKPEDLQASGYMETRRSRFIPISAQPQIVSV